jgi:protein-S-isoprenylcysteine O-methyltransferase Ste14
MMQWFHFQIGWLNLWILIVVYVVTVSVASIDLKSRAGFKRQGTLPSMSRFERIVYYLLFMFPPFVIYFYAIFVPFTTNMALLCVGLVLFVIGLALLIKQMRDFATAPPDQLITHGAYQISRNPSYFGSTLIALGMGLAGGSWLIVAFAVYWFIVYQWAVTLEERFCMARWPEELAEYKRQVAKNFLFF